MNLASKQIQALKSGEPVLLTVEGDRCILLREDVYREVAGALDSDTVYDLIEAAMADDDANDAGLESYQKYK